MLDWLFSMTKNNDLTFVCIKSIRRSLVTLTSAVYVLWLKCTTFTTFWRSLNISAWFLWIYCLQYEFLQVVQDIYWWVFLSQAEWGNWWKCLVPVFPSNPGGELAQWSRFCECFKKEVAHCLCKLERQRGGGSYFFALLEEDRWFCVWPSPRKCSLMSVQAAVMASGYSRNEGYRQQVLAAIG